MPKPLRKEKFRFGYYTWLLGRRDGIYVADGRSNTPNLGRHSLGTRDRDEALKSLQRLDLVMAAEHGRAERSELQKSARSPLSLSDGRRLYERHIARPQIAGGPSSATRDRYRPVLDKFIQFAERRGISAWNDVMRRTLEEYAAHLDGQSYGYATQYVELTTLKQLMKCLVENGDLPATCRIVLPLRKPEGTSTYCWRPAEVEAIVGYCRTREPLNWLGRILVALANTGLRISELASLRWTDLNADLSMVTLSDESTQGFAHRRRAPRTTKGRRSRSFPIHSALREVLAEIPRATDGLIFRGPRGGVIDSDTICEILVRDVLTPLAPDFQTPADEIGFADGRLHSFRHFFCSVCANQGVPEHVLLSWLGHRSSRMLRHYYHLHDAEAKRQMDRLAFVSWNGSGGCSAG